MRRLILLLALAACTPGDDQPVTRNPLAIQRLDRMKDLADRADWPTLAAIDPGACTGPRDAICAESQALRARACRILAATPGPERRARIDCAVESNRAALAAAAATPPPQRELWREALAWSLLLRRQSQPRAALCPDNAALRIEADALRGATPGSRFLAASARLTDAAEACTPTPRHCPDLIEARALLRPAPPDDPAWASLATATDLQIGRLGCPQP